VPLRDPAAVALPPPHPRLTPEGVVSELGPYLEPRRRARIETVLHQRLVSVTVVLENLYDPHNGAAALRSCEALGLTHVHVVSGAGRFKFAHGVTQKADKWLDVYIHQSTAACIAWLQRAGFACWAAAPPAVGSSPEPVPVAVDRPVALIFGNEHEGLTGEALSLCDHRFHLPLYGFSESFNLSVSVALALREVVGRRRDLLGRPGDLPERALARLRAAYYARATSHAALLLHAALQRSIGHLSR
jgi:tRNA (guanosine-2'-O-)-methyltransferase